VTRPAVALLLLFAIALSACGPQVTETLVAEQLAAARSRWTGAGVVDYAYEVIGECECNLGGRLGVTVEDGAVVDVVRLDVAGNPSIGAEIGSTVEDLFDMIEEGVASAESVEAVFDPVDGHPVEFRIVWVAEAADGAVSARVTLVRR